MGEMLRGKKRREAESERAVSGRWEGCSPPCACPSPTAGARHRNNKKISTSLVMSPAVLTARSPLGAPRALSHYSL